MKLKRLSAVFTAGILAFYSLLGIGIALPAAAAGNNCTWTGATDTNFSTATNWSNCGGTAPQTGDNLVFDSTSLTGTATLVNDVVGLSVANVTVQGSSGNVIDVTGNTLTLTGNVTVTNGNYFEMTANMTLAGNPTFTLGNAAYFTLNGIVSGTGNITQGGGIVTYSGANTFIGTVTVNSGSVDAESATALGNSSNVVSINDGADLQIMLCGSPGFTFANPISLTGNSSNTTIPVAKLAVGSMCKGGGGADETYGPYPAASDESFILSGSVTLGSDATFDAIAGTTTLTGALSGAHNFTLLGNYDGKLILNGSSNTTNMPNGTYQAAPVTQTLSDNQPTHSVYINSNAVVTIDGQRGDTTVWSGGVLKGTGTVGFLTVNAGGTVAPGHSPGCLNSGNLTLNGTYQIDLGGTTACTGYDQLNVTGTVDVTGATPEVNLYDGYKPAKGQVYTIINNDGSDAVTGTFQNLPEGATFTAGGYVYKVSYVGGDGNDVTLTVEGVPSTPDTGFSLVAAHPIIGLTVTVVAAGLLFGIAQRTRKQTNRS